MSLDRGAIAIYVAVTLVMLLAFSTLVVDFGIVWVARRQAQNTADAASHAAAVALAFNDITNRSTTGPAKQAALAMSAASTVWGQPPSVGAEDISFPNVPGDPDCATGANPPCVRVNVYRNAAHGNPLPSVFGHFLGIASVDIWATATAKARAASGSSCVMPWSVADRWQENRSPTKEFNRYTKKGALLSGAVDVYTPPGLLTTGSGYSLTDVGALVTLKIGSANDTIAPSFFFAVQVPLAGGGTSQGASGYRTAIATCNGAPVQIGDTLEIEPGNMTGPTRQGVNNLIAKDPNATWNTTTKRVQNSCAQQTNPCARISPRIVAVALFDTDLFVRTDVVKIANIYGFFVVGSTSDGDVTGYLATAAGDVIGTGVGPGSSFLHSVQMVK